MTGGPHLGNSLRRPKLFQLDVQSYGTVQRGEQVGGWAEMDTGWPAGSTVLLAVGAISAGLLMDSRFDSLRSSAGVRQPPARPGCTQSQLDTLTRARLRPNVLWGLTAAAL